MVSLKYVKIIEPVVVSTSRVEELEVQLNVKFPVSFVEFMAHHGGGRLDKQNNIHSFLIEWTEEKDGAVVADILHFGDPDEYEQRVVDLLPSIPEQVAGLVPFAFGFEFDLWCLDYRNTRSGPPVVYFDRSQVYIDDTPEDATRWAEVEPWHRSVYPAAPSFDRFLEGLTSVDAW